MSMPDLTVLGKYKAVRHPITLHHATAHHAHFRTVLGEGKQTWAVAGPVPRTRPVLGVDCRTKCPQRVRADWRGWARPNAASPSCRLRVARRSNTQGDDTRPHVHSARVCQPSPSGPLHDAGQLRSRSSSAAVMPRWASMVGQ